MGDPDAAALFACVYVPPDVEQPPDALVRLASEFSPRYERHGANRIAIDVRGLDRLLGAPRAIAEAMRHDAAAHGLRVHIAMARTWTAAMLLALARPGLTMVDAADPAALLAPIRLDVLAALHDPEDRRIVEAPLSTCKQWGLRTLGELAALPPADLAARLGVAGAALQALARGDDRRPLVPDLPEERFESSLELEWPIEGLEPLSFVLTRLLEPLSIRLERRDRGAAVLHVALRLVTRDVHARRLELPAPIRDVRTLRTLALLDLESHRPSAGVDRVEVVIEPTPGRVLQHTLFARAHPTPEQIATLLARLGALMGQDRIGAPALVDSHRPDAFSTMPFAAEQADRQAVGRRRPSSNRRGADAPGPASAGGVVRSALRRCRPPVPARVVVDAGRPVRVTTDRRAFAGGAVCACAGPWRSSGHWWMAGGSPGEQREVRPAAAAGGPWNRDEWDVALSDGAVYRVFQERETGGWFIDGIVD